MDLENRVAISTPEGVTVELVVAGIGSRSFARLLDTLIQGTVIIALFLIVGTFAFNESSVLIAVAFAIVGAFAVVFLYDLVCERLMDGQTPGKRAAGIRVVSQSGGPVTLRESLVRNALWIIDFLPFAYSIGMVSLFATERTQRVGDLAAGTLVVRDQFSADRMRAAAGWTGAVSVDPQAVAAWDVSAVTLSDVAVVRHFLYRRLSLPAEARWHLANDLVGRIWPRTHGLPNQVHPEYILEGIVVCKEQR